MKTISIQVTGYALHVVNALPSSSNTSVPIATNLSGQSAQPPNEIGWQSLFWSLFALALLAMTQSSVLDSTASFPASSILYPSRCSPIICATDTLEVLVRLAIELFSGANLRTACTRIRLRRSRATSLYLGNFVFNPSLDVPKRSTIKKHPIASVVVFLATLTQAVKVLGFEGVKWAQAIAACYLGSYLVLAAVQVLAREENVSEDEDFSNWSSIHREGSFQIAAGVGIVSLVASFMMCSWVIFKFNQDDKGNFVTDGVFDLYSFPVAFFILCSVMLIVLIRMGFALLALVSITGPLIWLLTLLRKALTRHGSRRRLDYWLEILFVTVWIGLIFYLSVRYVYLYFKSEGVWGGTTTAAGILCTVLWGLGFVIHVAIELFGRMKIRELHNHATIAGIWLVIISILHLVVACIYFAYVFDPTGTIKPAWTEKLG